MVGTLKFAKKTEKIQLKGSKKEGLKGNKITLKGKSGKKKKVTASGKVKKKKVTTEPFKFLKTGKSTYPGEDNDDIFAQMARGDLDDSSDAGSVPSIPSMPSSASEAWDNGKINVAAPMENKLMGKFGGGGRDDDSISVISSGSSVYSGSSFGSAGVVKRDKAFDIFKKNKLGANAAPPSNNPFGMTDSEAEEAEKQDLLGRFHALKARGVRLSKNYTARTPINELRYEMGRIEHQEETNRSVQRLRRWLLAFVSGAEWASDTKHTPKIVKGKLRGYSDYVLGSIEDYDPVFERMSERYGNVIGIGSTGNPLGDLFLLLATQMLMFVFMQHKPNVKPPSADEVKKQYPDMIRKIALEEAQKMRQYERDQEHQSLNASMKQQQAFMRANPLAQVMQPPTMQAPTMQAPVAFAPPQSMPPPTIDMSFEEQQYQPPPMDIAFEGKPQTQEDPIDYDVMVSKGNESMEGLHASTVPSEPWVDEGPQVQEPPQSQQQGFSDLPVYEPVPPPENLPKRPEQNSKAIELIQGGMSTRRGKTVKVNQLPKNPPAETPEEKSQDKRVIQLG